ncbi:MAG: hypothetical protein P4L35_18965 [Ignavibacteriaceae bacterium]|nr:hypothetical protein [Ignavibacteriaceae bacterium]
MYKYLLALFILFIISSPFIKPQQGAYIAPVIKFSTINGQSSNLLGVKGGWIINNTFVIGAEYYALNSNVTQSWVDPYSGILPDIKFSTGGLNFEYIFIHQKILSASAEMFMGGAGINLQPSPYYGGDFLVWEPQLNANINLNEWSHLSFGVSYRTTSALDIYHIDGAGNLPPLDFPIKNLRGWTGNISFVLGMY